VQEFCPPRSSALALTTLAWTLSACSSPLAGPALNTASTPPPMTLGQPFAGASWTLMATLFPGTACILFNQLCAHLAHPMSSLSFLHRCWLCDAAATFMVMTRTRTCCAWAQCSLGVSDRWLPWRSRLLSWFLLRCTAVLLELVALLRWRLCGGETPQLSMPAL
jgi:hypothetical protein